MHTRTHMHRHARAHARTHIHAHTHTDAHTHTHTHTHMHARACVRPQAHARTPARTLACAHAHSLTRAEPLMDRDGPGSLSAQSANAAADLKPFGEIGEGASAAREGYLGPKARAHIARTRARAHTRACRNTPKHAHTHAR